MTKIRAALFVAFATFALSSCDDQKTGSIVERADGGSVAWTENNPPVSEETWAGVQTLSCKVSSAAVCGPEGCRDTLEPETYVRWHPGTKEYQRCGGDTPCDNYTAEVAYGGSWANISVPNQPIMAKLTASGQFVEVTTLMDAVYVYHGQCKPAE